MAHGGPNAGGALHPEALEGWRVLEIADDLAASFCAKILADLGAEVLKVEPPGGHRSRSWAPRREDGRPAESGGRFLYLNTGKQSVVVDDDANGNEVLLRLVADTDVIVTDRDPSGLKALAGSEHRVITASITPFGLSGPYAGYRSCHLTSFHAGGEGSILPSGLGFKSFPDRPPIQIGSEIAGYDAGWNAAVAVLASCYDRLRTGRGQRIDVSIQESELSLNRTRLSRFTNDGITLGREGSRYGFMGMMECLDGWVQLVGMTPAQWDALAASPEGGELDDPRIATAEDRGANPTAAGEALAAWCKARTKSDVVLILAALGCPVGAYATPADLLVSAQLEHRSFFRVVDDGRGGGIRVPGPPYRLSETPVEVRSAPVLGSASGFRPDRTSLKTLAPGRGLAGVRILDFTWAAAGPYATALLAMLGAEVIKVESTRRPDPARRGFLADYGGINRSPNFNEINLNKRSFQVDLSSHDGLALAHRLAETADVVVDNFRPGVMARFGLDAGTLLAKRPDIIVASSSANGSSGPEAHAAGLASIFGATGGLSEQTGYADGPPTEIGESTDYRSANALAVGILAALLHRARTGQGQHVDLSSREVVVASSPDALLAHQLGVMWPTRIGNGHRGMAPHGVYQTEDGGWVAVAVRGSDEWEALCSLLGHQDWVRRYPTGQARHSAAEAIDAAVAEWTGQRGSREAFERLQDAGVAAMAVMTNAMLEADPHIAARGVLVDLVHPEIGPTRVMRAPWLFSDLPCPIRPGPLIGQDNGYVLAEMLGLAPGEQERLSEVLI